MKFDGVELDAGDIISNESGKIYAVTKIENVKIYYYDLFEEIEKTEMISNFNWQLNMNFFFKIESVHQKCACVEDVFTLEQHG